MENKSRARYKTEEEKKISKELLIIIIEVMNKKASKYAELRTKQDE